MAIKIIRNKEWDRTRVRHNDHATSVEGAKAVHYRATSQKARLLAVYADSGRALTDEDAARRAGLLDSCYWKRCGELRRDGMIFETGGTRKGEAGVDRILCRITDDGIAAIKEKP